MLFIKDMFCYNICPRRLRGGYLNKEKNMYKKILFSMMGVVLTAAVVFASDTLKVRASQDYISMEAEIAEPFNTLVVNGDIDVVFDQQEEVSARVYGSENLVKLVRVNVNKGSLYIGFDQPVIIRGRKDLQVRVTGPELSKIVTSDKGEVEIPRGLITQDLEIEASDRSEVSLKRVEAENILVNASGRADVSVERILKANTLVARSSGHAELEFSGAADKVELENRSREDIDAGDLRAQFVTASAYGWGDISCRASEELTASAHSWGKVEYEGFPKELHKSGKTNRIVRED